MTMDTPIMWGVGVGPGDPDLLTVKAARVLRETPLFAHFAKRGAPGVARTIAAPHLTDEHEEMRFDYPFTVEVSVGDPSYFAAMDAFYDDCAAAVSRRLDAGQSVAVLCEGDPFFYGSYMYLHERLAPHVTARVIPGVTGMSGCWTVADTPITRGEQVLTVLSGTLPADTLATRLTATDAAVVMKVGRHLPKIRDVLRSAGLLDRAIYVERATMADQRMVRLADRDPSEAAPYFSIVLVPGRASRD